MSSPALSIQSHRGEYDVEFTDAFQKLAQLPEKSILILDKNVSRLYSAPLAPALSRHPVLVIEASEPNKDLTKFPDYIAQLLEMKIKRDFTLVAIGGGVIQDITCFLASTLFRGMNWQLFPTTLLAQADSCIGSKSSINVNHIKNLMGTFLPPQKIIIDTCFLKTLKQEEILSGLGEMIKVHGIAGYSALQEFSQNFDLILQHEDKMREFILKSLLHKKKLIELDEFDTGIRNIMNYGHTFGHALESATDFAIPHGIAVTIGQSLACGYARAQGWISPQVFKTAQDLLQKNFGESRKVPVPFEKFWNHIQRDKKNVGSQIAIILPVNDDFKIEKKLVNADLPFQDFCRGYFAELGFRVEPFA